MIEAIAVDNNLMIAPDLIKAFLEW